MCTCTILPPPPSAPGEPLLIAFNRDEERRRPPGRPPAYHCYGARLAVHPVDPVSGGTWFGVNDAGLVCALLPVNPVVRAPGVDPASTAHPAPGTPGVTRRQSRGVLVPHVLASAHLAAAAEAMAEIPDEEFSPFMLLAISREGLLVRRWDGRQVEQHAWPLSAGPFIHTSSGLGDALVEAPRRQLFAALVNPLAPLAERRRQQAAFHRHRWPDRSEVSVCMHRTDASTVSHATVELGLDALTLGYTPGPPDTHSPVAHYALAWRSTKAS